MFQCHNADSKIARLLLSHLRCRFFACRLIPSIRSCLDSTSLVKMVSAFRLCNQGKYTLYNSLLWYLSSVKLLVWSAFLRFGIYKTFHTRYKAKIEYGDGDEENLCHVDKSKQTEYL